MRWRIILAAVAATVGLIWIGQGLGLLRGSSFMVDDRGWAVAGIALVVVAAALAVSASRARRPPP